MWYPDKCDLCGECLARCHYTDYDEQTGAEQIRLIMEGKEADILKECVTCCACNEYCPNGANPFDLINRLQEEFKALPIPDKARRFMDAGATVPSALVRGDPSRPALSLCVMEPFLPPESIGGRMFDGLTQAKGGDYFCYLGYVHIGMESPLKDNAQRFVDSIASIGAKEVVFLHADCHAMISKVPEFGVQVPFKVVHIAEYMRDYLKDHPDEVSPLNMKIAYQRPCASRYSPEIEPVLDEMFRLIGVERAARKYDRESAQCCGGLFARIFPDRVQPLVDANVQDAADCGAEAMVFLCPLCMGPLAKPVSEKGLKPIFITQLVRMALGELAVPG